MLKNGSWEFRSLDDIERFWPEVCTVPMRAEGREHYHEEQRAAALYLLLLGRQNLLRYPFRLDEGESPDFLLSWQSGETGGLEVTRMTTRPFQRLMTRLDSEFFRREKEARARGTEPAPAVFADWELPASNDRVRKWCDQALHAMRRKFKKLAKFRQADHHDLLICNDADVPLLPGREREQALDTLAASLKTLEAEFILRFSTISLIMSLDLEYDISRSRKLLLYR